MFNPCLIIFSKTEAPAWDIPLLDGQAYVANDDIYPDCLRLVINLNGSSSLTQAQEDFLVAHPDVLKFDLFADCSARSLRLLDSIPDSRDAFQSHRSGILDIPRGYPHLPLMGDEPIWRRVRS